MGNCIEIVPYSDLFGRPGMFTFHNTGRNSGPFCGGEPTDKGDSGSFDLARNECLDHIFGSSLRKLLSLPLWGVACKHVTRSLYNSTLNVTFSSFCTERPRLPRHVLPLLGRQSHERLHAVPLNRLAPNFTWWLH